MLEVRDICVHVVVEVLPARLLFVDVLHGPEKVIW
jgi:hypothetical protein